MSFVRENDTFNWNQTLDFQFVHSMLVLQNRIYLRLSLPTLHAFLVSFVQGLAYI
jgi:hypothetical protein